MGRSFLYGNVPSVIIDKCPCGVTVARTALSPIFHFFFRQFYIEAIIWHKILLMFAGSIDELHFFDIFGSGNFIGHSGEIVAI